MTRRIAYWYAAKIRAVGLRVRVQRECWGCADGWNDMLWTIACADPKRRAPNRDRHGVGARYANTYWHSPGELHYGERFHYASDVAKLLAHYRARQAA